MTRSIIHDVSVESRAPYDQGRVGPTICSDRLEYWLDDPVAHVVATFADAVAPTQVRIELLRDCDHGPIAVWPEQTQPVIDSMAPPGRSKVIFFLAIGELPIGTYELRVLMLDPAAASTELGRVFMTFSKVEKVAATVVFPEDGIPIEVDAQSRPHHGAWPVEAGVPLPVGLVADAGELALFEDDVQIAATFEVRGRWHKGRSIKWLGVAFMARWNSGVARSYRLKRRSGKAAIASELTVSEEGGRVAVDTGAVRFFVSATRFAGVEIDGYPDRGRGIRGGPYVIDDRATIYEAWREAPQIEVSRERTTRVRIVVAGWYVSEASTKFCRYHTQITAFAGSPHIHIAHHTILTSPAKLVDLGWRIPAGSMMTWRTSYDGRVEHGEVTVAAPRYGLHQASPDSCFGVVENGGGQEQRTRAGERADGWFSAEGNSRSITVALRDFVEKFPKEIELARERDDASIFVHFWPRHGYATFRGANPPDDPLDRRNIHKLWYAHQGRTLDLAFPDEYGDALHAFVANQQTDNGWDAGEDYIAAAQTGDPTGVAIGNEFAIFAHRSALADEERATFARVFQHGVGALARPAWSAACNVEGQWAARDTTRFPQAERMLELALPGYRHAVVDVGREYGMWIYGGVHDVWSPSIDAPRLHRVWQASHYRNVWMGWFLYLRSGLPALREWARISSDRHLDTGTVHHPNPRGKPTGDLFHCYAFTPWGGPSELWGHFADPDAFRLRFLLTGDSFARQAYDNWWQSLREVGNQGWRNSLDAGNREAVQTLGVLVDCYRQTFDYRALELMRRQADGVFRYHTDPASGTFAVGTRSLHPSDHPVWHRQWAMLYHDLTRDRRAIDFIVSWIGEGYGDLSPNAFASLATGDASLLTRRLPSFVDQCLMTDDDPADRYHGYGPGTASNVGSYLLQQTPYFLRALREAGINELHEGTAAMAYPTRRSSGGPWNIANVAQRVYAQVSSAAEWQVHLRPLRGYGMVFEGMARVWRWDPANATWGLVTSGMFDGSESPHELSLQVPGDAGDWLCRIDLQSHDVRMKAPWTPFPEVAVIWKLYDNGSEVLYTSHGLARQDWWVGSVPALPSIELVVAAARGFYDMPAFVATASAGGGVLSGETVFAYAQNDAGNPLPARRAKTLTLRPPGPWRIFTASHGGPLFKLSLGAGQPDHLFLGRSVADLDTVLPLLSSVDRS